MIKGRLIPFLAVFLLVMAGCNRYDFNNRDEYKKLSEQKRYASIEKSIKKNKINNEDKLQVKYIDIFLNNDYNMKILASVIKVDDFQKFFDGAVPIIYYAYSKEKLLLAPNPIKENVEKVIIHSTPLVLNNDAIEKRFRLYLKKELDKGSEFVFRYYVAPGKTSDEVWSDSGLDLQKYIVNAMPWLSGFYTYGDFSNLDVTTQAEVIKNYLTMKMLMKGKSDDNTLGSIKKIALDWYHNGSTLVNSPSLKTVPATTPFDAAFPMIFESAANRLKQNAE